MVDFRPLLFINALAIMLLVTAGFAPVKIDTGASRDPVHGKIPEQASSQDSLPAQIPASANATPTAGKRTLGANIPQVQVTVNGKAGEQTRVEFRSGTWIGGIQTGDGTYQDREGLRYEGGFVDGRFHGIGTAWYPNGSRYEGDWQQGLRTGEGTYRGADGANYTGQFSGDRFNGQGTLTRSNGDTLTGQWVDGRLNGHGSVSTADGMLYVGGLRNDLFHDEGSLTYPDGRYYEGKFSNGEFHGKGSEVFASGKKYEGEYLDGKFHGRGLMLNPNGSSIQAMFRHGHPYGPVVLITAQGEVFNARTSEPGVCYRDKSYRATHCPPLEDW